MIWLALEPFTSSLPNESHLSRIAPVTAVAGGGFGGGDWESRPLSVCNNGVLNKREAAYFSVTLLRVSREDVHMMEYYSATKRKEVLIRATAWMNLANFMLSEKPDTENHI